jgi:hypothetical protein
MKKPFVQLPIVLLVSITLFFSCQKRLEEKGLTATESTSTSATLLTDCSDPQRFRDMVFTESQIQITPNNVYRHASSDYASGDAVKVDLTYDYYNPVETDTSLLRPLIILLPGGGFTNLTDMNVEAKRFARYGFCVAALKYRVDPNLTDTATYFTVGSNKGYVAIYRAVQDVRFAIRLAKQAAPASKIDSNYIFVGGVSAGAITALHVAYLDDNEVPASLINVTSLGLLDHGGNQQNTAKVKGVFAHAGGLTGLNMIESGDIPAFNMMSLKDTYFSLDCSDPDLTYRRIYFCGARAVANQLTALGIQNKLTLLPDNEITVNPVTPGDFTTHSHGSIFTPAYMNRDVDSTVSFIYSTFHPNPCLN